MEMVVEDRCGCFEGKDLLSGCIGSLKSVVDIVSVFEVVAEVASMDEKSEVGLSLAVNEAFLVENYWRLGDYSLSSGVRVETIGASEGVDKRELLMNLKEVVKRVFKEYGEHMVKMSEAQNLHLLQRYDREHERIRVVGEQFQEFKGVDLKGVF